MNPSSIPWTWTKQPAPGFFGQWANGSCVAASSNISNKKLVFNVVRTKEKVGSRLAKKHQNWWWTMNNIKQWDFHQWDSGFHKQRGTYTYVNIHTYYNIYTCKDVSPIYHTYFYLFAFISGRALHQNPDPLILFRNHSHNMAFDAKKSSRGKDFEAILAQIHPLRMNLASLEVPCKCNKWRWRFPKIGVPPNHPC